MKAVAIVVVLLATSSLEAQELEPRSYTPAPIGTTIVLASVGGSKGDILFDPSLDVDGWNVQRQRSQEGRTLHARGQLLLDGESEAALHAPVSEDPANEDRHH